jgi:hypothetical protein
MYHVHIRRPQAKKYPCVFSEAFLEVHYAPLLDNLLKLRECANWRNGETSLLIVYISRRVAHENIIAKTHYSVFILDSTLCMEIYLP